MTSTGTQGERRRGRPRGSKNLVQGRAYEWDPLLGHVHDTEIAEKFGVHYNTVWRRRQALGIPALVTRPPAPYRHWVGLVHDSVIARCWGVTEKAVADTRRRMQKEALRALTEIFQATRSLDQLEKESRS